MKEMERSLGLFSVVAIALSAMLGNGIFLLPGLAAEYAGDSVWMAYLLAAFCTVPAAASKAEMATAMPTSGGAFIYLDRIFGPWVGTITGVAVWLSSLLKAAFALIGVGLLLSVVIEVPVKPTALILLTLLVGLNWVGVKAVSRAQMFVIASVLLFLLGLTVASLVKGGAAASDAPARVFGTLDLFAAAGFVVVSFNGVTKIAAIAEEVRNPARVVPLGVFVSLGVAAGCYALVSILLARGLSPEEFYGNPNPVHSWAEAVGGAPLAAAAALFGVIALASLANTGVLAASRFPFAMSRDHLLPSALHGLSPRFSTPTASISLTGAAMAVSIVLLDVEKLAKLASAVIIGIYIANNVAVIVFRESGVGWYRPKFKLPLYPWLPAFGVLSGLGLLFQFGSIAVWALLLAFIPGTVLFFAYGRARVNRRGVVLQRGRREELIQEAQAQKVPVGTEPPGVDSVAATLRSDSLKDLKFDDETPAPSSYLAPSLDVEDAITGRARAVVAMFGDERAPETLAEIGAALCGFGRLPVVHLTEVPEQTILGAVGDAPALLSLRRRLRVMAEEEGAQLEFHSVHSRDIIRTVHAVTSRVECDFLVLRWRGRTRWALMPYNPLGWLVDHLDCNLALFRDSGVRYIREILVFAEPGPHDALAVGTADDLARRWGARITLVRPLAKDADDRKRAAELAYLGELSELCEAPVRTALAKGNDAVTAITRESTGYDLLVMGIPQASLLQRLQGTPSERIARKSACSVLMLKTPRVKTHEAYARKRESHPTELIHFVHEDAVAANIQVHRKEALFEHVAATFAETLGLETKLILDALWERERTQNTSVGHGVALPHATLDAVETTVVGVFTMDEPLDYHGPDGQKVDVAFVIVSPPSERQRHLEMLSTIARLALATSMLDELREAQDRQTMLRVILDSERSHSSMPVHVAEKLKD